LFNQVGVYGFFATVTRKLSVSLYVFRALGKELQILQFLGIDELSEEDRLTVACKSRTFLITTILRC
jgi:F0F1-type ATP synthase beta subunit